MNKIKSIFNKLKNPSVLFSVLFSILGIGVIVTTIVLLALGFENNGFMILLYLLSAIMLSYLVYIVIYYVPKIKQTITKLLKKYKFTNELLSSYGYRSVVFAVWSFFLNVAYAVFQAVIAVLSSSIWYGALAVYYLALSLIRGGIIVTSRKRQNQKLSLECQVLAYRNCGIYLMLLNFALLSAIVQMVLTNNGFQYAGIMIYVMALYTFYKLALSIYNIVKAKKEKDYLLQTIKNISFADSLVSILALQTAMLHAFSPEYKPYIPNSITGGVVSVLIITLGVIMFVSGQLKLKKNTKGE